ncbi:MAG: PKD domain-containing protein, partial [Sphingobacteriaceae bacterium]
MPTKRQIASGYPNLTRQNVMKKIQYIILYSFLMLAISISSCKKNNDVDTKDVDFSVNANGYLVTYTNATTDAKSYKWDFGDGTTSTDVSPSHTYKTKGKFVVTLYATLTSGNVIQGSTIVNVSKTSPIKLDDNTLADWDTITHTVVLPGPKAGVFQKAKFDYDSQNIYIYLEFKGSVAVGNIFDFYLDTD